MTGLIQDLTNELKVQNKVQKKLMKLEADRMAMYERREIRWMKLFWGVTLINGVLAGVNVLGLVGLFTGG